MGAEPWLYEVSTACLCQSARQVVLIAVVVWRGVLCWRERSRLPVSIYSDATTRTVPWSSQLGKDGHFPFSANGYPRASVSFQLLGQQVTAILSQTLGCLCHVMLTTSKQNHEITVHSPSHELQAQSNLPSAHHHLNVCTPKHGTTICASPTGTLAL